jgi:hypothetical protein
MAKCLARFCLNFITEQVTVNVIYRIFHLGKTGKNVGIACTHDQKNNL